MAADKKEKNELPPLPSGHGFATGDRVEIPVYGNGIVRGTVVFLDTLFGKKRYKGLAILGDDKAYYELDVLLVKKIES